jgi:hypothetical protein
MGMPPPVLLVEDDGARLVFKPELALDLGNRLLEGIDTDRCVCGGLKLIENR